MRLRAMAKINLGLDVIRKREDGYHEVRMIMQTVRMYDTLEIRKNRRRGFPFAPTCPMFRLMREILFIRLQRSLWMNFMWKRAFP